MSVCPQTGPPRVLRRYWAGPQVLRDLSTKGAPNGLPARLRRMAAPVAGAAFLRNVGILTIATIGARGLGFLYPVLAAHLLSLGSYGMVRYNISIALILCLPVSATSTVIARFLAEHSRSQERHSTYYSAGIIGAGLLLGVTVALVLAGERLGFHIKSSVLAVVLGLSVFYVYGGVIRGASDVFKLALYPLTSNAFQLLLLAIVYWGVLPSTVGSVTAIYGLSYLLPVAVLELVKPTESRFLFDRRILSAIGDLGRFYVPVAAAHAAYTGWISIDILFLGHFRNAEYVGAYSAAKTLVSVIDFVPTAVATLLLPKLASLGGTNVRYAALSGLTILVLSIPLAIALTVGAPLWLSVLFGSEYAGACNVVGWLSLGMTAHAFYTVLEVNWIARSRPQLHALCIGLTLAANVLGQSVLTPNYGPLGAAVSFASSMFVGPAVVLIFRVLGSRPRR